MRTTGLVALALTAVAGIAAAALWTRPPEMPAAPAGGEAASADESAALAASKGLSWRDGGALNFRLKSGETLTLSDRASCGDLPCPKEVATRFRYLGWDNLAGGYKLAVTPSDQPEMILPYGEADPILVDAHHAGRADKGPMPLPTAPPPAEGSRGLADWLGDIATARSQNESPLLAASHGEAVRKDASLALRLTDGRHLVLTDDLVCGQVACPPQVFRSFDYAGTSPDGRFHVVEERWNEASAAFLIDARTGALTALLGLPKFSPDGKRAVASVADLEWSAPRRLEIWSLDGAAPGIEFAVSAGDEDDTVYEVVGWDDADHIRLRRGSWSSEQRSEVMLAHDANGWHMEASDGVN